VDWYDALFNRHTINTKANINISGGGQVATYYVAGGYDNETGLLKVDNRNNFNNNIDIDRFHVRTNVIFKLSETTKLDTRINGRFERYSGPYESASNIFRMIMNANPVDFPAFYEPDAANRYTEHTLFGNAFVGTALKSNPYAEMVKGYENRSENTFSAQATLAQDLDFLVKGLKLQIKASASIWSKYSQKRKYNPYFYNIETYNQITGEYKLFNLNPTNANAYLPNGVESGRDANGHYYFEARINWDRQFGKHSVGFMTVGTAEEKLVSGGSTIYETLPERNMGNSGRITYDYDLRYFFEFAYGYNGSEKFTGEKKYGFFPSFGAGWLVSNEPFWESMKNTVSNLKLKFTYGLVGNDAIGALKDRFHFLSDISLSGGAFTWGESFRTSYPGYQFNRYANPDINWEVSSKYNLGLELGFFKNESLKFQIDFFKDVRSRIYWPRENFPSTAGLEATISGNVGKAASRGIDASLDFQRFINKDFWITGRANFTYATSKVLEKDEKDYADEYLKRVGHNINQRWGLVAERLFVDDEEIRYSPHQDFETYMAGDIKYTDINGDGVVNPNDEIPMGYPSVPEIQYGFGLSSGYRKFDFSFFFQGNARVSFFINAGDGSGIAPFANRRNALAIVARDSWTEDNPDVHAFWPRLSTDPLKNNTRQSSWWLRNGSFLRLKTVELGYSLPDVEKIAMRKCRIYANVENVFVTSPFKQWDPEMGSNGLGYPLNRRFNVGIQVSF
jgi:TonB-linked SusC/RagA family outer membrane protein